MLIGVIFFSWGMASLTSLLRTFDERSRRLREKMSTLFGFMRIYQIQGVMNEALVTNMPYIWRRRAKKSAFKFTFQDLLNDMPNNLRRKVGLQIHSKLVASSKFLSEMFHLDKDYLLDLLSEVRKVEVL